MHKQDFVHVRALIEECCEKDQTIKALKEVISRCHEDYSSLSESLTYEQNRLRVSEQDNNSYIRALSTVRADLRLSKEDNEYLRNEIEAVRRGPIPSNEDVIDLLRAQLPDFHKSTSPKIAAIKTARELQRCGLKEAKDLVESMPEFQSQRMSNCPTPGKNCGNPLCSEPA